MEEKRQLDNDGGIIMDSIKYVGTSVFSFIFEQYLTLVNTFLSSIQKQLAE